MLKDVTSYKVYLRPDGSEYKLNQSPNGETFQKTFREVKIGENTLSLDDKFLEYYELNEGYYQDEQTRLSKEFNEWVTNNVKKDANCGWYEIINPDKNDGWYKCVKVINYKLP